MCSRHFLREDFKWSAERLNGKRLKSDVVPSLFSWTAEPTDRPNPLDKVRLAQEREFHESDIRDDDDDDDDNDGANNIPATEEHTPTDAETIAQLRAQLQQQKEEHELMVANQEKQFNEQLQTAKNTIDKLSYENTKLKREIEIERFGVERFGTDDTMIRFYTGFPNHAVFHSFFNCIQPCARNMQSYYYRASEEVNIAGKPSCMKLIDELFMFLCRLRLGLQELDLADRFHCSKATVSRKVITWCNLLYMVLGSWNIWLSREKVNEKMPQSFKPKYQSTRVIIDCTEIKTQVPKSLVLKSQTYSHYKGAHTFKGLIGIAPHGLITFVSSLYTGCMSDVEITKLCGILDLLEPGDSVMADKGFTIEKLLEEKNVSLNMPPFLRSNNQFTRDEITKTQEIASVRIHVERAIARIKTYQLFSAPIPLTVAGSMNQLWTVASLLANFQGPLIN